MAITWSGTAFLVGCFVLARAPKWTDSFRNSDIKEERTRFASLRNLEESKQVSYYMYSLSQAPCQYHSAAEALQDQRERMGEQKTNQALGLTTPMRWGASEDVPEVKGSWCPVVTMS